MPILHKNITAETDIHNPKWFSNANNGDYAWKNEQGNLESIDELLLPAALNFVDGSVAPPTSNTGDIYVLSSGGSVDAGWGSVSLQDWVRYDGAAWNAITPQKSSLCYNENTDKLLTFDGTAWAALGGDNIYTADGTLSGNRTLTANGNALNFEFGGTFPGYTRWDNTGSVQIKTNGNTDTLTVYKKVDAVNPNFVSKFGGGGHLGTDGGIWSLSQTYGGTSTRIELSNIFTKHYFGATEHHRIQLGGGTNSGVYFWRNGYTSLGRFIIGGSSLIGTEDISFQGETIIKGEGTGTGTTLALYDDDTTPNKNAQFLDNGQVSFYNLPTSSAGLSAGDIWNDSGTLKIV